MPTGVPLGDAREQLTGAAVRVLRRDGPHALTSRAVTTEAGLAKGILHRYFPDFDTFIASLVLTRIEALDHRSEELRSRAGSGKVADNLCRSLGFSLDPDSLALVALVLSRRDLLDRLRLTTPTGIPLLAEITRMIAAYLTAERGLGRIAVTADVDRLAVILVGTTHLLLADRREAADATELRPFVSMAIADVVEERKEGASSSHGGKACHAGPAGTRE